MREPRQNKSARIPYNPALFCAKLSQSSYSAAEAQASAAKIHNATVDNQTIAASPCVKPATNSVAASSQNTILVLDPSTTDVMRS